MVLLSITFIEYCFVGFCNILIFHSCVAPRAFWRILLLGIIPPFLIAILIVISLMLVWLHVFDGGFQFVAVVSEMPLHFEARTDATYLRRYC